MSGTGKPGQGSGVGPASGQSVEQTKYPFTVQVQDVWHPPGPLLAVPHPSPGMQAAPCVQPTGVGGPGGGHVTPH
jgi:hypothetical protein